MRIVVAWANLEESILVLRFAPKWQWADVDEALQVVKAHLSRQENPISLVFDMRETLQPKMNALKHYQRLLHPHPKIKQIIFIGLKEGMAWILEIYLSELSSNPLNYTSHFVADLSEAEAILGTSLTIPD